MRRRLKKLVLCLIALIALYTKLRTYKSNNSHGSSMIHSFKDTNYSGFDISHVRLMFSQHFRSPCFIENVTHWFDTDQHIGETVYDKNHYVSTDKYPMKSRYGNPLKKILSENPHGVLVSSKISGQRTGQYRLRCLPYFMVIGVAKSGTTDMYEKLCKHPLVLEGVHKELFYWTHYTYKLAASVGDYADLFDGAAKKLMTDATTPTHVDPHLVGDFTSVTFTDYRWWRDDPRNKGRRDPRYLNIHDIHALLPNVKLIIVFRNPTARLYSSYNMFRDAFQTHASPEDFHLMVIQSIDKWHNCTEKFPRRNCAYGSPTDTPLVSIVKDAFLSRNKPKLGKVKYVAQLRRGMYSIFVKEWLSVFPRNQMLFIKMEEYAVNRKHTFNDVILPHLNLPIMNESRFLVEESISNSRKYPAMLQKTKKLLDQLYEPFNKELAEILQSNKWLWLD